MSVQCSFGLLVGCYPNAYRVRHPRRVGCLFSDAYVTRQDALFLSNLNWQEVTSMTETSLHYHANWSFNDRKHRPDPPPKLQAVAFGASLKDASSSSSSLYQLHRRVHRRHRQDSDLNSDQEVCTKLVKEYGEFEREYKRRRRRRQ